MQSAASITIAHWVNEVIMIIVLAYVCKFMGIFFKLMFHHGSNIPSPSLVIDYHIYLVK